jgi:hypothetical protein
LRNCDWNISRAAAVERFVAEADAVYAESATQLRPGILPENDSLSDDGDATVADTQENEAKLIRTTVLEKILEDDEQGDNKELRSLIADPGDTLIGLLTQAGAEQWQANAINDAISAGKCPPTPARPARSSSAPRRPPPGRSTSWWWTTSRSPATC